MAIPRPTTCAGWVCHCQGLPNHSGGPCAPNGLYPEGAAVYRDNNAPIHTAKLVREWFEHESEVENLPWLAQSPDFNIIESLWGVLEERTKNRFPAHRLQINLSKKHSS